MANVFIQDSTMSAIGEAIREKTGGVALIYPKDMAAQISSIKTGAVLQEKTVTPTTSQQEVTPDAEYDGLSKVTVEAMQVSNTASPTIEVSDAGLIQASVQYSEGYIAEDTRKTAVKQLPIKAGERVIPSTADKVAIEAGVFTTWPVTVAGDANLVPEKIKKNESIFGIVGTYEGSGGGSGGGGGGVASEADINFYDYDGTLVAAWTLDELATATALPDNPTHAGLTAQGWNWTLDDLKKVTTFADVGQMYVTDDGKTRLYIHVEHEARRTVYLQISQTVENGVTIDWGDGASETISGTGYVNTSHLYATTGEYVISLTVAEGCALDFGTGAPNNCVLGVTAANGSVYSNMLQKVEIGSGVTTIGQYAFYGCLNLANINIPNSITSIGKSGFFACRKLANGTVPNGADFNGFAFSYCFDLKSIALPKDLTISGNVSIARCYNIRRLAIPEGVTTIECSSVFCNDCYNLTDVTIPEGITSIGSASFQNCANLANITIPESVTEILSEAFIGCCSLKKIVIPNSVTKIEYSAFCDCKKLAIAIVSNRVVTKGDNMFKNCYNLTDVTIPEGITSIGYNEFYSCIELANVTIPNSVTKINGYAFYGCYKLATITIPAGVTSIGANAFGSCTNMVEYHIKPTTPPSVYNKNAFNSIPSDCIIYVPKGCLAAYQSASVWSNFASYMQEEAE